MTKVAGKRVPWERLLGRFTSSFPRMKGMRMNATERMQKLLSANPRKLAQIDAILNDRWTAPTSQTAKVDKRLVTISGAARLLALGRNTVYRLVKAGRLQTVELNGCSRITMQSIDAFLDGSSSTNGKEVNHAN